MTRQGAYEPLLAIQGNRSGTEIDLDGIAEVEVRAATGRIAVPELEVPGAVGRDREAQIREVERHGCCPSGPDHDRGQAVHHAAHATRALAKGHTDLVGPIVEQAGLIRRSPRRPEIEDGGDAGGAHAQNIHASRAD